MTKQAIVVTTEFDGVFFGYGDPDEITATNDCLVIEDARMCIYWPEDVKGVLGLTAVGPIGASKVTAPAPSGTLRKVSGVFTCTPEAERVWLASPWH